jgi:1-deoxy-D-xylulose-5-phosphate reductoisomerase
MLANKEALVMGGALFMEAVRASGARLMPIDSEHNAIFQCLPPAPEDRTAGVERLILTGSGGPLLRRPVAEFAAVTPDQACAHPNWKMGRKISVDSATMMNKGLEVIEACWLFDVGVERIEVLIHPQSVVHSMVRYRDGSVLAQLGQPDMRTPIAHGLAWPERIDSGVAPLELPAMSGLHFETPDYARFPCLRMAMEVARRARTALPVVLNAANEVGVAAFLERGLPFPGIASVIERSLGRFDGVAAAGLEEILELDAEVRRFAAAACASAL